MSLKRYGWLAVVTALTLGVRAELPPVRFQLNNPGTEKVIDYEQYGEFKNKGTTEYHYVITNRAGLIAASGDAVDPSTTIYDDPGFDEAVKNGKIDDNWWRHVSSSYPQIDLYCWHEAAEEPGVRQFYIGKVLERAGLIHQALKAYRACMVLYPDSASWSSSGEFSWSIAEGAWNQIINILQKYPELGLELVGANVRVIVDDVGLHVSVNPGKFIQLPPPGDETEAVVEVEASTEQPEVPEGEEPEVEPVDPNAIVMQRGTGTVQLVKYGNGDWKMFVEGEPYIVKGVVYDPTKVGVVPWEWNWMWADDNTNGTMDLLEVWLDKNRNNQRDEDEPVVGDFQILKDMGCNTIKTYNKDINKYLMRKMFHDTGIRVVIGNFAGAYCHDSGASWEDGTDYNSRDQKANIKAAVRKMVEEYRNEPWLLAYILGNENNMPSTFVVNATRTNANKYPEAYARFLNELAAMIHGLDPNHPVGVGNLMTGLIEFYADLAPELDFIGVNCYIGPDGFGSTWEKVKQVMDRPIIITEYGCDSFYTGQGPDEKGQAEYHMGNWQNIDFNMAGKRGAGNALGGFMFEWVDEWWKDNKMKQVDGVWVYKDPLDHQNTHPTGDMAFPDGKSQEEWLGIMSQGDGSQSPFLRAPKTAYYEYQAIWTVEDEEPIAEQTTIEDEEPAPAPEAGSESPSQSAVKISETDDCESGSEMGKSSSTDAASVETNVSTDVATETMPVEQQGQ